MNGDQPNPAPDRHEASRAAFEAAYKEDYTAEEMYRYMALGVMTYRCRRLQECWEAWKRALDHAAQEQPANDLPVANLSPSAPTVEASGNTPAGSISKQEQPAPDGSAENKNHQQ